MSVIWTNPSIQRSLVQRNIVNSDLLKYAKYTIENDTDKKYVSVFTDMEYKITFYDASYGNIRTVIGLVMDLYDDQIKIKRLPHRTRPNPETITNCPPMPTCNCVLNPPDTSKYNDPEIIFIPSSNILDINYITSIGNIDNMKGTRVMLLGISATTIKAIIIRLEFFDDCLEDAIKLVDMEVGGIYNIVYECGNTIFESVVKLISIEEIPDTTIQTGKGYVRENVGVNNSVYTCCTKTDFMSSPPVSKIKLIVDTSETFEGRYECIMLDSIRDCTLIQGPDGNTDDTTQDITDNYCTNCCFKTCNCTPETCGHYHCSPSISGSYKIGDNLVIISPEGNVEIHTKDGNGVVGTTITEILSYYLGV